VGVGVGVGVAVGGTAMTWNPTDAVASGVFKEFNKTTVSVYRPVGQLEEMVF